ncbi:DUF5675 family protein [Flavobacterium sp.]|jgi:hypothetical protein|uniref:DUF5675 family protein n=1 Tax=Flavobacterium sp. TaxID=239 RepID=UPI0037BF55AE
MKFLIFRDTFTNESTLGKFYIDGKYKCYSKEECGRTLSRHSTALQPGEYALITEYSDLFQTRVVMIIGGATPAVFHPMRVRDKDITSKGSVKLGNIRIRNGVAEDWDLAKQVYDLVAKDEINGITSILHIR